MPQVCFVPGCHKIHKDAKLHGEINISHHTPPKDPAVFKEWQRVIPRTDRLLHHHDIVCSRHFKKGDIIYYSEPVTLYDGSVYLHMLDKARLKKGAIPSIFLDITGHSTNVSEIKSSKKMKCEKRKYQSVATTKQLKVQKLTDHNYGAVIEETEDACVSEKVLKTDFSLLPSVILNCLTSESPTVLSTINKTNTNECQSLNSESIAKNNLSSESPTNSSQCHLEKISAKENVSLNQSKLNSDIVSKVPEKVSSFIKYLSSNMEIISFQPNKESDISDKSQATIFESSEVTEDISDSSQEIVQLSPDSQSNQTNSEVSHKPSDTVNSNLDFRENFTQLNHTNESRTKSHVTLQPLVSQDILNIDPDAILKSFNKLGSQTKESKNIPQPKSITTATEVTQQLSDTNVTEPTACLVESETDVNMPLSVAKNQFCFDFLKANTHKISKINSWWRVNTLDDFVIYVRWNSDCMVDRKVIIYKDLKIKVFLKEKEVIIENSLKATSIENISNIILKVEGLQLCENFLDKKRNCNGYLDESFISKQRNLCLKCIKWEEERLKEEKQLRRLLKDKKD